MLASMIEKYLKTLGANQIPPDIRYVLDSTEELLKDKQTKLNELTNKASVRYFTIEEIEQDESLLLESPVTEDGLMTSVEEYLEEFNIDSLLWKDGKAVPEEREARIKAAKTTKVFRGVHPSITHDWLWNTIAERITDEFYNDVVDPYPEGEKLCKQFVEEFNKQQKVWISDNTPIGIIDLSEQVKEKIDED